MSYLFHVRRVFFVVMMGVLLFPNVLFAHEEAIPVSTLVRNIMDAQGVTAVTDISCDKIDAVVFEELGESLMTSMHPDEEQHAAMDAMMGGEGSESLRNAHIFMAQQYLGCSEGTGMMQGGMMYPLMMGGGMMGGASGQSVADTSSSFPNMMRFGFGSWWPWMTGFGIVLMILFWGAVFFVFWMIFRWFRGPNAIDALRMRYARGEMSKEEFENKKRELQ